MARKFTMFELHFDGVRLGGAPAGTETEMAVEDVPAEATPAGRSLARRAFVVGMLVGVVLVGRRVVRRYRGRADGGDDGIEVETADADGAVA